MPGEPWTLPQRFEVEGVTMTLCSPAPIRPMNQRALVWNYRSGLPLEPDGCAFTLTVVLPEVEVAMSDDYRADQLVEKFTRGQTATAERIREHRAPGFRCTAMDAWIKWAQEPEED